MEPLFVTLQLVLGCLLAREALNLILSIFLIIMLEIIHSHG